MKLGFPNHPRRDILEEIQWIADNGFDFVDLFIEPDTASLENINPAPVRKALDRYGLRATGHTAWYIPIGSQMRQLREAAVEIVRSHLPVFSEIGVSPVTIHSHWPSSLFTDDEGIAWQTESLAAIIDAGKKLGVCIMYEPIGSYRDNEDNLRKVLNALPDLACHLDIGHCALNGKQPERMIRVFSDRLEHLHISDNDGHEDLHLPPGTGVINWNNVFATLRDVGYDKTVTLEVYSEDRDYVLTAKRKIESLIAGNS